MADADATALGFGVDVVFKAIPKPMLDAAVERRLPVFNVPYEIPFRDIVRYVTASALQDDAGRLARVIAIQDDLLAAIERPDGERELVDRLGSLLGARVALFAADGRVLAVAGHPPLKELWGLATSGVRAAPFGPRGYALVQEVESGGYLAVLLRSTRHADSVARPVARFAARAVNALAAGRRVAAETDRLARSSLLRRLLEAPHIDRELVGRLRAFGFQPAQPLRVLVARSPANASDALHAAVDSILGRASPSLLVEASGCQVVAAWQGPEIADALRGALPEGARAGLSSSVADVLAFAQAVAEARAALAVAREGDRGVRVARPGRRAPRAAASRPGGAHRRRARAAARRASRGAPDAPVVLRARPGHHGLRPGAPPPPELAALPACEDREGARPLPPLAADDRRRVPRLAGAPPQVTRGGSRPRSASLR